MRRWFPIVLILAGCTNTVAPRPSRPKVAATAAPAVVAKTPTPETGFDDASPLPTLPPRATAEPAPTATPKPPAHDDRGLLFGRWGIVGRVTKAGVPLPGRVIVLRSQLSQGHEPELNHFTTDADGIYVLPVPPGSERPNADDPARFAITYNREDTSPIDSSRNVALGDGEFRAFATDEHELAKLPTHQEQVDFDLAWDPPDLPIAAGTTVTGPRVDFSFPCRRFPTIGLVVWQGKTLDAGQRVCDSEEGTGDARWTPTCTGKPDGAGLPAGDYLYHLGYFDYDQKATTGAYLCYSTPWIPFKVTTP